MNKPGIRISISFSHVSFAYKYVCRYSAEELEKRKIKRKGANMTKFHF